MMSRGPLCHKRLLTYSISPEQCEFERFLVDDGELELETAIRQTEAMAVSSHLGNVSHDVLSLFGR